MEDGVFPRETSLGNYSNNTIDYDLMDELLSEGCWLEATGGTDFFQQDPSTSTTLFSPSPYLWPGSEINYSLLNLNQLEGNAHEEEEKSVHPEDLSSIEYPTRDQLKPQSINKSTNVITESSGQSEYYPPEGFSESIRRWWIGPVENLGPFSSVRERLYQALGYIKDSLGNGDALIQIWLPIKRGSKHVLTTNDQPYTLGSNCPGLANYRSVSVNYEFAAEKNSDESIGLPGRVFLEKVPEWTPDVRLFSSDEYPRIGYAHEYDVRGTVAVPIFERGNRSCLGVLEVVMTTQKINYHSELENVCQALEAVDLRSSEVSVRPYEAYRESCQAALPEIVEVLRAVCETHKLPLAQTWFPCTQQGKRGCRHSDENYAHCISTMNSACYVTDPLQEFHEACSEHHLFIGQGVAGKAFTTNQPCFSTDITTFSRTEYPLIHYAKVFELRAAVAIRLRSIYGRGDYVLEFFLPVDCDDINEQMRMLDSLSVIIQQICQNFRVITDKELEEEKSSLINEIPIPSDGVGNLEKRLKLGPAPLKNSSQASWITSMMEAQQKGKIAQEEGIFEGFRLANHMIKPEEDFHQDSMPESKIKSDADSPLGDRSFSSVVKPNEKKRTKVEKTISLQVLRQYFAGSLKDAAKNIGVCPTTLKRICRQHGIKRWPSRKIKKVGHSLRKLQVVIDSVQGAEGAFKIGSLYANFPELSSPNLCGSSLFSMPKETNHPKSLNTPPEGIISQSGDGVFSPQAAASKSPSSSCSQSSSSSLYCSSEKQNHPHIAQFQGSEVALQKENLGGLLKRACSDAKLHVSFQEEPMHLERCHSLKSLPENPSLENLPLMFKSRQSPEKFALRVKVTYGEEKVRFSMQTTWTFKDLQREISKRFHIDDMSIMDLKYLDDDSEWILLTCDEDVEECIDVYKSSMTPTVKLAVHQASQPNLGSSLGSSAP